MEKSDPVNGWPQRALSLRDMMMMMTSMTDDIFIYSLFLYLEKIRKIFVVVSVVLQDCVIKDQF